MAKRLCEVPGCKSSAVVVLSRDGVGTAAVVCGWHCFAYLLAFYAGMGGKVKWEIEKGKLSAWAFELAFEIAERGGGK